MDIDEGDYIKDLMEMKEKIDDDVGKAYNRGLETAARLMEILADEYYQSVANSLYKETK